MEKISQWWRGEIFLIEENWKKVVLKKALSKEKYSAINREIQILQKLKVSEITFVPKIIESWDWWFKMNYIEWTHFDKFVESSDTIDMMKAWLQLLNHCFILDKLWVVHWELTKPFSNIIVDVDGNVFILDFERWKLWDFSWKNLRSYAQWLKSRGFLTISDLKKIGEIDNPSDIYDDIKTKIKLNLEKNLNKTDYFWFNILRYPVILWTLLLIIFDQWTKFLFYDKKYFTDFYLITPLLNKWVAFGVYLNQYIIYIVALIAILLFSYLYYKKHIWFLSLILFLAWTIWNILDRLVYSWVRDFIDLHFWPVFNVADSYLTFAMILIIWVEVSMYFQINGIEK